MINDGNDLDTGIRKRWLRTIISVTIWPVTSGATPRRVVSTSGNSGTFALVPNNDAVDKQRAWNDKQKAKTNHRLMPFL